MKARTTVLGVAFIYVWAGPVAWAQSTESSVFSTNANEFSLTPRHPIEKFAYSHNLITFSWWWCKFDPTPSSEWPMGTGSAANKGIYASSQEGGLSFSGPVGANADGKKLAASKNEREKLRWLPKTRELLNP